MSQLGGSLSVGGAVAGGLFGAVAAGQKSAGGVPPNAGFGHAGQPPPTPQAPLPPQYSKRWGAPWPPDPPEPPSSYVTPYNPGPYTNMLGLRLPPPPPQNPPPPPEP